jgi:pimeloyl-ACP methyl ester carboxylesterase
MAFWRKRQEIRPATLVNQTGIPPSILFIHGLSSSPEGTWDQMISVCQMDSDLSGYNLGYYTYPTSFFSIPFAKKASTLGEVSRGLETEIHAKYSSSPDLTLVGHSLGGIVARQYILNEIKKGNTLSVKRLILYAVPNTGSALAGIAKNFRFNNPHLVQLCQSSDTLDNLNDDWIRLKVEDSLEVTYVVGGADKVVNRQSARGVVGSAKVLTLVDHNHRSIVRPSSTTDTRYILLKKALLAGSTSLVDTSPIGGDPLFDIYSITEEPYYLERQCDHMLATAGSSSHVWVDGASGVGKTAALKRFALAHGFSLKHIMLGAHAGSSPEDLIHAVCAELMEMAMLEGPLPSRSDAAATIGTIRKSVRALKQAGPIAICIEEIPIPTGSQYGQFIERLLHVVQGLEVDAIGPHPVRLLISSIRDPAGEVPLGLAKFREKFQFLPFRQWTDDEVRGLIHLICEGTGTALSDQDYNELIAVADGSPRFIKMVFRKWRNGTHSSIPLSQLLDIVKMEQL